MKLENPYVVLQHPDRSPAIFRTDRISRIDEMPGGRSLITYGAKAYTVLGKAKEVCKAVMEAKDDFIRRRFIQELKQEWEEHGCEGAGKVPDGEPGEGTDIPVQ